MSNSEDAYRSILGFAPEFRIISHGWNHEDVVLDRTFSDQPTGFYIDVGAGDPLEHSITHHFYELGWSGVNIEPQTLLVERLAAERPRDVNLGVALSDRKGTAEFFRSENWEISTLEESNKTRNEQDAGAKFTTDTVPVTTLDAVWEEHVGDRTVDFLKVDVEGHEHQVLSGLDLTAHRPRVVIVESIPVGSESSTPPWESLLIDNAFRRCLFDGINLFYVRDEDADELSAALSVPANAMDKFLPVHSVNLVLDVVAGSQAQRLEQVGAMVSDLAAGVTAAMQKIVSELR